MYIYKVPGTMPSPDCDSKWAREWVRNDLLHCLADVLGVKLVEIHILPSRGQSPRVG